MTEITTLHYLVVAASLFIIGTIGVLTRRNVIIILMSIELILNAVNLNQDGVLPALRIAWTSVLRAIVMTEHHRSRITWWWPRRCSSSAPLAC